MIAALRWTAPAAAVVVAACALCAAGIAHYRFDPSYRAYFAPGDPLLADFDTVRAAFDRSDVLLVLVEAAAPGGIFSAPGIDLVARLTRDAATLPAVRRVDSLVNHQVARGDADTFAVGDLLPAGVAGAAAVAVVRDGVRDDGLVRGRLVDAGGNLAVIALTAEEGTTSLAAVSRLHDAARAMLDGARADGFTLHLAGPLAMNHAFAASTLTDFARLLPLSLLLLFGVIVVITGSWRAGVQVLALAALAVGVGMGAGGWLGVPLTTASALAPIVIVTVAVANGLHVLVGVQVPRGTVPRPFGERLEASLASNRGPITLTASSTAIGFLTMNLSDMPPLQDLGLLVAIGALAAGVLSLAWLPLLARLWPPVLRPRSGRHAARALFIATHARRIVVLAGVLVMLLPLGLPSLRIEEDFVRWFAPDSAFGAAARVQARHLGGLHEIEFLLDAGGPGRVHDAAYLRLVDDFAAFARAQPEVRHVLAWTDVLRTVAGPVAGAPVLPADAAGAAQYLLLYQMALPPGFDANRFVDVEQSATHLHVLLRDAPSSVLLDVEARLVDWWRRHAGGRAEQHGGVNLIFAHLAVRNAASMIEGDLLVVAVTGVLLSCVLRSLLLGMASLAMNLLPVVLAFALWGLWSGAVGLALSTAAGVTLGIVIDDTVHLLLRYRRERRAGADVVPAMQATLVAVSPALLATTAALAAGFGVLALSTFQLNAHLGGLAAATILVALLLDLVVLPAGVVVVDGWRTRRRPGSVAGFGR